LDKLDVFNNDEGKIEISGDKKQTQVIASKRYRKKIFLEKSEQKKLLDCAVARNEYLKEVSSSMKSILKELIELVFEKIKNYTDEEEIMKIVDSCQLNFSGQYFEELFTRQKKQKLFLNVIERTKFNREFCMKHSQLYDSEVNNFLELFIPEIPQEKINVLNAFTNAI
jgi:hypothetical protein